MTLFFFIHDTDGSVCNALFWYRYMDAYRNETLEFVEAIVNDTKPPTSARDGKAAMVVAKAAKKSLEEGRTVLTSEI